MMSNWTAAGWRLVKEDAHCQVYSDISWADRKLLTVTFIPEDRCRTFINVNLVWEYTAAQGGGYVPQANVEREILSEEEHILGQSLVMECEPEATPKATPEDENDCVIVATKHLNELGNSVPWKKMLMFVYIVDGKRELLGHAVAVFKRSEDGNVWVNDKSGSDELATTSTDANEILRVLGEKYSERFHKQVTLIGGFDKGSPTPSPEQKRTQRITEDDIASPQPDRGLQPSKDTPEVPAYSAPAVAPNNTSATAAIIIFAIIFVLAIALYALSYRDKQPATISRPSPVQVTPPPVPTGPFAALSLPNTQPLKKALINSWFFWIGLMPCPLIIALIVVACDRTGYRSKWGDFWTGFAIRFVVCIVALMLLGIVSHH
jgi:hypothetical protein